jgi:hypothetical protein
VKIKERNREMTEEDIRRYKKIKGEIRKREKEGQK